jgi:hypothetical protein
MSATTLSGNIHHHPLQTIPTSVKFVVKRASSAWTRNYSWPRETALPLTRTGLFPGHLAIVVEFTHQRSLTVFLRFSRFKWWFICRYNLKRHVAFGGIKPAYFLRKPSCKHAERSQQHESAMNKKRGEVTHDLTHLPNQYCLCQSFCTHRSSLAQRP